MPPQERPERRLWRIDLNDVEVRDEYGNSVTVDHTVGELDGRLVVHVRLTHDDTKEG